MYLTTKKTPDNKIVIPAPTMRCHFAGKGRKTSFGDKRRIARATQKVRFNKESN